ncbi:hypothetical protein AXG93_2355s1000 [Marchantia polymorpha subsp. ruderalis]|uniref:Uncharacterized protein n=1 Tax=Marchantia polymorpha subsp. ruderalis TaxID=1480154 RepID=A0A176WFV5_MARPO|nr:hypothetical protein AXG93_2355s1000 [Marchantia polymorpha subsp. ruderalis]
MLEAIPDVVPRLFKVSEWVELEAEAIMREKDGPLEKNLQTSKTRPSAIVECRATRKKKEKAIMTEEENLKSNLVPLVEARPVSSPQTSMGTVIFETGDNPSAEEIQLEGVNAADVLCGQVIPLLRYLDSKLGKYARPTNVGSYVELVRNKTRVKVAKAHAVVEKQKQLREIEAKYEVLWKRLVEEVELRKSSKKACESLRADIEFIRCATVDLRDRPEAFQVAFNKESRRVDELIANLEKKYQTHAAEVATKVKAWAECEAARILDLELIERLR